MNRTHSHKALRNCWLSVVAPLSLLLLLGGEVGCASAPRSTVMTVEDYEYIAAEIGQKLGAQLAEGFLADRNAGSAPMVLTIKKVVNLTSDMMTEGAKWYLMAHVRGQLPLHALATEKNVHMVIPAESLREARKKGTIPETEMVARAPTHLLDATFRSVTRSTGDARTDLYYCEYQITNLHSGQVVWTDRVEFKKAANIGKTWD